MRTRVRVERGYVYLELRRTLRYCESILEPTNAYLEVRRTLRYVQRPKKSCQLHEPANYTKRDGEGCGAAFGRIFRSSIWLRSWSARVLLQSGRGRVGGAGMNEGESCQARLDGKLSQSFPVGRGVKQGSVLCSCS